jgi:hypothetical protein
MNAGRSPQRVGAADLADQIPHVSGYAGSAVGAGLFSWPVLAAPYFLALKFDTGLSG